MSPAFITAPPRALCAHSLCRTTTLSTRPVLYSRPVSRRARFSMQAPTMSVPLSTKSEGEQKTLEYRLFFQQGTKTVSPWHDIPIYPNDADKSVVNFVNEIPRGTTAKMEIATEELNNPIKQDVKKGNLRFYKYGPSLINYGAIPQTWEDPNVTNSELNVAGDGDPVDVCDIGDTKSFAEIYSVKILGCLGLLDEGEIDWKVIGINTADPKASQMNDIADVEEQMPGVVSEIREWFRMYKTAEGKGENEYAYGGEAKDSLFAQNVVAETHQSWADLKSGKVEDVIYNQIRNAAQLGYGDTQDFSSDINHIAETL